MERTGFSWLRTGYNDLCKPGNETSGSIRTQDIFDKLSDNQLSK
jgi:hypothetical protein